MIAHCTAVPSHEGRRAVSGALSQADTSNMHAPMAIPRRAFTLIELIAVIVVLAVLAGIAAPRFLDASDDARESAAEASIAAITTALSDAFIHHRVLDAPSTDWINDVNDIAALMEFNELPEGVTVDGSELVDQTDTRWRLTAETETDAARLTEQTGAGDDDAGSGDDGSGDDGSAGFD